MAKFARVGYGSDGRSAGRDEQGYTYVVNDNVRAGDTIQPSVKHYKNGNIFGTTGKVLGTAKETSVKGKQLKSQLDSKGREAVNAYTGKELGAERQRGQAGKFAKRYGEATGEDVISSYQEQSRGGNILARQQQTGGQLSPTKNVERAVESFEQYSYPYMKKGDNQQ